MVGHGQPTACRRKSSQERRTRTWTRNPISVPAPSPAAAEGLDVRKTTPLKYGGRVFFLDIPFYRTPRIGVSAMNVSDYFAELLVAGRLADAGWNVHFPHRDQDFDFIITKTVNASEMLIRPVQVKGKYPTGSRRSRPLNRYAPKSSIAAAR